MTDRRIFVSSIVSVVLAGLGSGVWAQAETTPAEFPPTSFKGAQYVDSRGCVFVRAGIDGNVTWVPRMTRQRKHICGMQPTPVAGNRKATAAAPKAVQITLDQPAAQPVKRPKPRVVAAPKPKPAQAPKPRVVVAKPVVKKPVAKAPIVIAAPAPKPAAPAPKPVTQTAPQVLTAKGQSACPDASAFSQRYINDGLDNPVRCGPQEDGSFAHLVRTPTTEAATTSRRRTGLFAGLFQGPRRIRDLGTPTTSDALPGDTRVVPVHVARARARVGDFTVPEGYRPAWDDDRLNPYRAQGTLAGRDSMNLYWTATVPRRLIDARSGRDVTAKVALVYPFTDRQIQQRELGEVTLMTRNGQLVKRIRRNPGTARTAATIKKPATPSATTVYSTRSQPADPAPKQERLAGKRYVQVATFGVKSNAHATAARLKRLGLPTRIGQFQRNGKTLRIVLSGPFSDDTAANKALASVRKAGFGDAFLRK